MSLPSARPVGLHPTPILRRICGKSHRVPESTVKSLVKMGTVKKVPQFQSSKGTLIVTAALELIR